MRASSIIILCALACLVSSSPIDHNRQLINRPPNDVIFRTKHSAQIKGHNVLYVKGGSAPEVPEIPALERGLRKGEYICGNKVCKLRPGEIPAGCEGHICQYPLANPDIRDLKEHYARAPIPVVPYKPTNY